MFQNLDSSQDQRVDFYEFKNALVKLREWGLKIEDPESAFKMMDTDNSGSILFDHFSHFCITQHIDFQTQDND